MGILSGIPSYSSLPLAFSSSANSFDGFDTGGFGFDLTTPLFNFNSTSTTFDTYNGLLSDNFGMTSLGYSGFNSGSFDTTLADFIVNQNPLSFSSNPFSGNYSYCSSGDFGTVTRTPKVKRNYNLNRSSGSLQQDLANAAQSWVGQVNSDAEGNRLFSPNAKKQAWCADFVTYNVRNTFGNSIPSDFGSSSVNGLMNWGIKHDCYIDTTSISNKKDFIANNVKAGDIMIEKRNGKSHTGIVKEVYSDGSFLVVEGNCTNSVKTVKYSANSSTLSGFISLDQYAVA